MAEALELQARSLLSADAVRARAGQMLEIGLAGGLSHFTIDLDRMDGVADAVIAVTRKAYPTLDVPFHARWRHFVLGGVDRWARLADAALWPDRAARARAEFDLAIVSVLLDAGAGAAWRYRDAVTGEAIGRSEGLAIASLDMFANGLFSGDAREALRADADVLTQLPLASLTSAFQASGANPLLGLEGRVDLLRRLGKQVASHPEIFGRIDTPRPGGLFDHIAAQAKGGAIAAPAILSAVLNQLGPIWPSRLELAGVPLGDCWRHPAIKADDATAGLVPLHKLSQWLSYSLIEPLQRAGFEVTDIDGLTGLAEYRNGGLFVDHEVLRLRDAADAERAHAVDSLLVVEWRALTVALLDQLAERIRAKLGRSPESLPLASILEGGTWAAGRAIAFARRPDGSPPLKVISDGTVF
ncbi:MULTISPECIES: URC4/urg3 family protein [Bradyrhizobium]|uniref:URC4/urg3 family protein n=1 Tax=Bradyrhizobium TaxID=374 RepID=UPI00230634B1|nr:MULTISPECIES: URC4/urg3 family protein [unclassified Bradyrhizobium]MDA9448885.1 uracil phosphoribosyltransferase [Bradyrhizobium sp. CCBAU 21360]MDA9456651.1 uracil phosphoribosyltransferase [Bradyrhizobium sp. CCBAU 21359]MDA9517362.1 uracil phosphoribosyltransferase [Bradyrhizobium sp. CCBAU 11430]